MGILQKFRLGLQKTQARLAQEMRRIFTSSPRLTGEMLEELEGALIGADLGMAVTQRIIDQVKQTYETQGASNLDVVAIAEQVVEKVLGDQTGKLKHAESGLTVISVVGVNGTGKTTTAAKLAAWLQNQEHSVQLAACDTFRAAAIEQLKLWGQRLQIPVIAGAYGTEAASVAHDSVSSSLAKNAEFLIIDTAGRLHTKTNLMAELQKLHRVVGKQVPGAPHEVLLVLDATTGMNALNQAREFNKAVPLSGLVITKLDGTSKGGMVVGIQHELKLPVKFVGVGERADDLQPFDPHQFAVALFEE